MSRFIVSRICETLVVLLSGAFLVLHLFECSPARLATAMYEDQLQKMSKTDT